MPLIVGLGKAAELAGAEHTDRRERAARAKRSFLAALREVEHQVNGDVERSQAHVVNVSFRGVDKREAFMLEMRDSVAISNGSACTSNDYAPSHVLKAMGLGNEAIDSSIRISWGSTVDRIPTDQFVKGSSKAPNLAAWRWSTQEPPARPRPALRLHSESGCRMPTAISLARCSITFFLLVLSGTDDTSFPSSP